MPTDKGGRTTANEKHEASSQTGWIRTAFFIGSPDGLHAISKVRTLVLEDVIQKNHTTVEKCYVSTWVKSWEMGAFIDFMKSLF